MKKTPETTPVEPVVTETEVMPEPIAKRRWSLSKRGRIVLLSAIVFLIFLLSLGGVLAWHVIQTTIALRNMSTDLELSGRAAYTEFKQQNLPATATRLTEVKSQLTTIDQRYQTLRPLGMIPFAGRYYQDGLHGLQAAFHGIAAAEQTLAAIVPYADVLGFAGEGTFQGGTAEDRLKVIIETIDKIMPVFDGIANEVVAAQQELAQINPMDYPEMIQGKPVRQYVQQMQGLGLAAVEAVTKYRPILAQLPEVAGGRNKRAKYLILFQNDNELRPTGGFLTAYATVFVENGKVTPEKSDDIYELDKRFTKKPAIPAELGKYLTTEKKWNLRDMNTSPDFVTSMNQFLSGYRTLKGEPQDLDGIIAIDTEFVTKLLKVLGPVEVPGYGTFTAEIDKRCDCPQIIYVLSEIITRPTPYLREDRKGILGPLMRAMLTKAYQTPKNRWPEMMQVIWQSMQGRHIQLFFSNPEVQKSAESLGVAGRMTAPGEGDFLAIVDANLGGQKSNLFTTYEVTHTTAAPADGKLRKTVEITYKNSRKADNCNLEAGLLCLNATLRDWSRIYVPKGSTLVDAQGYLSPPTTYDENGLTVIDGNFTLEPLGVSKLKLTYDVPYTASEYQLYLWKQGGVASYEVLLDTNGNQEKKTITQDLNYSSSF